MPRMTARSATPETLAVELGNRTVWHGDKISGHPMRGIVFGQRGVLPEPYWTAARDAMYAVYHHETPIAWETEAGIWYVPNERYSQTTSAFRSKVVAALEINGATVEWI